MTNAFLGSGAGTGSPESYDGKGEVVLNAVRLQDGNWVKAL
jgi:hypothetical protein